jgi:hypothetical protein
VNILGLLKSLYILHIYYVNTHYNISEIKRNKDVVRWKHKIKNTSMEIVEIRRLYS